MYVFLWCGGLQLLKIPGDHDTTIFPLNQCNSVSSCCCCCYLTLEYCLDMLLSLIIYPLITFVLIIHFKINYLNLIYYLTIVRYKLIKYY